MATSQSVPNATKQTTSNSIGTYEGQEDGNIGLAYRPVAGPGALQ